MHQQPGEEDPAGIGAVYFRLAFEFFFNAYVIFVFKRVAPGRVGDSTNRAPCLRRDFLLLALIENAIGEGVDIMNIDNIDTLKKSITVE